MNAEQHPVVRVTHSFRASPERVFDAWLDPAKASRFLFATPTGEMVRAEVDARVGGAFCFVDRRDGVDVEHVGEYVEIDRPRRLVFTFLVPKYSKESTRVTIEITPLDSGCELTLTHEGVLADYREATATGWASIFRGLGEVLSRRSVATEFLRLSSAGDVRRAYALYVADGFRHHNPFFRGDKDALLAAMEENAAKNPQKTLDIKRSLEDSDLVAVHSHVRPRPGERGAAVMHIFRFEGDKIAELWDVGQPIAETSPNDNGMF